MTQLTFYRMSPEDSSAAQLIEELSETLATITGSDGKSSFSNADIDNAKSVFLVAKSGDRAVACGALRRVDDHVCELKRMFARDKRAGIGSALLNQLEWQAAHFGYDRIRLETRKVNHGAVSFYLKHGYMIVPNYGKYVGNDEALCFEKKTELTQARANANVGPGAV